MSRLYKFALREAPSDVSGFNVLAEVAGIYPVELDFALAANAALGVVASFLTPAPSPNQVEWVAGEYVVGLLVVAGPSIEFTVALWRADLNGNLLAQIGSTPANQTAPGASEVTPVSVGFTIAGQDVKTANTDRLALQVLAKNDDSVNAQTFSILTTGSSVTTPIEAPDVATNALNPFRRNKFLGLIWRRGDGSKFFDKNGVDLDRGNNY